jgi:ribosomal protein L29
MKKGVPSVSTEELKTKIDKLEKELEYYRNKEHSAHLKFSGDIFIS